VSLASALARVQQLQSALTPVAPQPSAPQQGGSQSFDSALQGAMATPASASTATATAGAPAAPGQYPHLRGDLDAAPELLRRLEALARSRGQVFNVTSGLRTRAEQQRLWDNRGSNPYPVAPPGTSRHESGRAADVTVGGAAIQTVIPADELRRFGIAPLAGDAVHVELPS
jgi:LAS superfamily LD-carboxypeptidase LdcB